MQPLKEQIRYGLEEVVYARMRVFTADAQLTGPYNVWRTAGNVKAKVYRRLWRVTESVELAHTRWEMKPLKADIIRFMISAVIPMHEVLKSDPRLRVSDHIHDNYFSSLTVSARCRLKVIRRVKEPKERAWYWAKETLCETWR
jgi:hypothetical protein